MWGWYRFILALGEGGYEKGVKPKRRGRVKSTNEAKERVKPKTSHIREGRLVE